MRILEVTESFASGTMEVVRLIAEGAARQGHEVTVAHGLRPETPSAIAERISPGIELVALPWTPRTPTASMRVVRELRRIGRDRQPDVVHLHSSFAGFVGSIALATAFPTVYTPHAYSLPGARTPLHRLAYTVGERITARRVAMIGGVSQSEARLARALGARAVRVIPNGIPELDEEPRMQSRPSDGRIRVVAMGRLVAQRRPAPSARILRSVADLADVTWIGGPSREDPVAAARSLGIPVTGWLDREEAVRHLGEATVLLNWSAWDGSPLSVLEAMAHGVLVIGSDIDANRELLGDAQVCASEAEAIELLRRVLSDPSALADMLAAQRTRSHGFGAREMVRRWLAVYEDLAAERSRPGSTGGGLRRTSRGSDG